MRNKRRYAFAFSCTIALVMLATGVPRRAAGFDYVVNGGFEAGDAPWSTSPTAALDAVDASVVAPHEGLHSGRITLPSGASAFTVRQTSWGGTPPGTYHFSAWVRTTSRLTDVYIQVGEAHTTNDVQVIAPSQPDTWVPVAGDIAVTGYNSIVIIIGGHGTSGDVVYVDDVRFEGNPPATMTPTDTPTLTPSATPPPDATSTPTPTPTKPASPTKTPPATHTPSPAAAMSSIEAGLQNADFEDVAADGLPDGWQKYGGTLSAVNAPVHSGSRAARLESTTDSTKWLYQTVLVQGDDPYEFGAWVLDDDANVASAFLRVSWYASDDGSGAALASADSTARLSSPSADYRYLTTGAIVAPGDARSARLRILLAPVPTAAAAIYADDASFALADPAAAVAMPAVASSDDAPDSQTAPANQVLGETIAPASRRADSSAPAADAGTSTTRLKINEVMYDPAGIGTDADGEWVELYNAGDEPIDLAGWSLADAAGADALPVASVEAHGFIVIAASDSFRQPFPDVATALVVLGGRIGNSLGNDGDRLVLREPSGAAADAISWGTDTTVVAPAIPDVPSGHSIERRVPGADTDAASDFIDNMRPSPGAPFAAAARSSSVRQQSDVPQTLPGNTSPVGWLLWSLAGTTGAILLLVLSWRAAPFVTHRLKHHS